MTGTIRGEDSEGEEESAWPGRGGGQRGPPSRCRGVAQGGGRSDFKFALWPLSVETARLESRPHRRAARSGQSKWRRGAARRTPFAAICVELLETQWRGPEPAVKHTARRGLGRAIRPGEPPMGGDGEKAGAGCWQGARGPLIRSEEFAD